MLNFDIFLTKGTFGVPSLCNLKLQKSSCPFIQTLHNGCPHIEDAHLLFYAHFMNVFSFWRDVKLRRFCDQKSLDGVWFV